MKVFISHAFGREGERLGGILKEDLEAAGMDGYMAERAPKYNQLIADKIKRELEESDWLVAVITELGCASASVHEEIGYALGRDAEVALMLKKGVETNGVLVYGRETMIFSPGEFKKHSLEMVEFIKNTPPQRAHSLGQPSQGIRQFLDSRGLMSETSHEFALNEHYWRMHSGMFSGVEKPAVLFTACPRELGRYCNVTASEFMKWTKGIDHFDVEGHRIPVRGLDAEPDAESLVVIEKQPDAPPGRDIRSYREFQDNGFFEYGASSPHIVRNHRAAPSLHLCLLIGSFWGFLLHARLLYQRIDMKGPFTVLLSVRYSYKLALGNYGDEVACPEWSYAKSQSLSIPEPHTGQRHIRLPFPFDSAHGMTDRAIADAAREAARKVCNAYGQDTPKCYNADGKFAWDLWECVSR